MDLLLGSSLAMIDPVTTLMVHEELQSRFKSKLQIIKEHIKELEVVYQC